MPLAVFGLAALALIGGCEARLSAGEDDAASRGAGGPGDEDGGSRAPLVGGGPIDAAACDAGLNVMFGGLRRVTKPQYNRMVRDLLGDGRDLSKEFGFDSVLGNFAVNLDVVSEIQVEQYFQKAEEASEEAMLHTERWLKCDASDEEACAESTIADLGRKAYRRPLTESEASGLFEIYQAARSDSDFENGLKVTLEAILTSPEFLYHFEFGFTDRDDDGIAELTPYEMASRLAQFLWQSIPDDALLDVADSGALGTAEEVRTQAERMLADPKARDAVGLFHQQWLRLGETMEADGEHSASAGAIEDTLRTTQSVILDEQGSIADLFSVSYGFLDEDTKSLYGVTGAPIEAGTDGYDKYALDPAQRGGLLSRAGFLGANSPPSGRGKFIREQLLCGVIPPPPPGVDTALPDPVPGEPPRAQWERHVEDPSCGTCHKLMDPLGFAFDHYDHHGHWRETIGEEMWAVEDGGEILATTDIDGAFEGAQELQARLSESVDVQACFTYQWLRFATGRNPGEEDTCSLSVANDLFSNSGDNIYELLLAVTMTDAFRFRRIEGAAQ